MAHCLLPLLFGVWRSCKLQRGGLFTRLSSFPWCSLSLAAAAIRPTTMTMPQTSVMASKGSASSGAVHTIDQESELSSLSEPESELTELSASESELTALTTSESEFKHEDINMEKHDDAGLSDGEDEEDGVGDGDSGKDSSFGTYLPPWWSV